MPKTLYFGALIEQARNTGSPTRRHMLLGFPWQSQKSLKVCRQQLDQGGKRDHFQIVKFFFLIAHYLFLATKIWLSPLQGLFPCCVLKDAGTSQRLQLESPGLPREPVVSAQGSTSGEGNSSPKMSEQRAPWRKGFNTKTSCSYSSH